MENNAPFHVNISEITDCFAGNAIKRLKFFDLQPPS